MDRITPQKKNEIEDLFATSCYSTTVWRFLLISLLIHAFIFIILKNTNFINMPVRHDDLPAYEIELLRPPVDAGDFKDLIAKYDEINIISDIANQTEQSLQDTITLDTTDPRYESYAQIIKQAIMSSWIYPEEARKKRIEGTLVSTFSIDSSGNLLTIKNDITSGHSILNEAAQNAIRTAAPFPPFPPSVTVPQLNVKAGFTYRLSKKQFEE